MEDIKWTEPEFKTILEVAENTLKFLLRTTANGQESFALAQCVKASDNYLADLQKKYKEAYPETVVPEVVPNG